MKGHGLHKFSIPIKKLKIDIDSESEQIHSPKYTENTLESKH